MRRKKIVTSVTGLAYIFCFLILMCLSDCLGAQSLDTSYRSAFDNYYKTVFREKVFLHINKTVYATGEIIWLKAYISGGSENKLSGLSQVCYVELIDRENKSLLQAKLDIQVGRGNGQLVIPASIPTGNYTIRAYTKWMKNFNPEFFFSQTVSIINPSKKNLVLTNKKSAAYAMQFFPEGGDLVNGLRSLIAFEITDLSGTGINANGVITNSAKDTIATFSSHEFGMGSFFITPTIGERYLATIIVADTALHYELPQVYKDGWTLHVADEGNSVHVRAATTFSNERGSFLFIHTNGILTYSRSIDMQNNAADFIIEKSLLKNGISQMTIFNGNKEPVCERMYFKKPSNLLQLKLDVDNIENGFSRREVVDAHFEHGGTNASKINGNFSVSVFLIDSLQPRPEINIVNYLYLLSGIKGNIENPSYYLESDDTFKINTANELMLTHGWRRFRVDDNHRNAAPMFKYVPEHEGVVVSGKVTGVAFSNKKDSVPIYLSVPGIDSKFANTFSNDSGAFRFNLEKFYGQHEVILLPGKNNDNTKFLVDNPFADITAWPQIRYLALTSERSADILTRSIGAQVYDFYKYKKENYQVPVGYDTIPLFGNPTKTYQLDAYTRFSTMEEVMREYVKEVRVKRNQDKFHFEVYNELSKLYFDQEPLVLLDGMPVFNLNKLMNVDPLTIQKVDVTAHKVFRGNSEYAGVVSYSTYKGNPEGYELDPGALVINYEGLQLSREFYSPLYNSDVLRSSRIPDYRNALFWEPDLKMIQNTANFSFYTSDIPGTYLVIVQGILADGTPGYISKTFVVNDSK
ncbi:MAG: hypothetical protein ABIR19_03815 [Ginsengibacter sp.]